MLIRALLFAVSPRSPGFSAPTPQESAVPGGSVAGSFVGGVAFYGMILTLAGVALSAGLWAFGSYSSNYTQSINGKRGFIACAACATVIGGAYAITAFFYNAGSGITS